jgi:3-hydroxyisobutyrate dehydrogenase-like beta-hydroxyacid dehydrogenase
MTTPVKIAILGLGEEARSLAAGLQATGGQVVGFDSVKTKNPGIPVAASAAEAVADADVVFSLNSASVAARVAEGVANHLKAGALYADLNSGTPGLKKQLAGMFPAESFVDFAFMNLTTEPGQSGTFAVSGGGARRFLDLLTPLGIEPEYVSEVPGEAAARRILRSILDKGLAAVISDTLWAAKSLGMDGWAIEAIKREFDTNNAETVQALLNDTGKHPKRRSVEMSDISELLSESNYDSTMVNGIGLTYSHVMHGRKIPFADLSDD